MNKKNLQGYTFTRNKNGLAIPTNIQSGIIRNYCEKNNYNFKLHLDEFCLDGSFIQLFQILKNKKDINAIGMCSIYFLPENKDLLQKIFSISKKRKIEIIFIFENIIFKSQNINIFIKEISQIKKINFVTKK